jgi:drug/metabolite transporter (DMT)-like permease
VSQSASPVLARRWRRTTDQPSIAPRANPNVTDVSLLAIAVIAGSTAAPMIAAVTVPALAIVVWRAVLALLVIAPWSLVRRREELRGLDRRSVLLSVASGSVLALHFAAMAFALAYTSVASAMALVSMQTIWTALFLRLAGAPVPRLVWIGSGVSLTGVLLLTGVDLGSGWHALLGNGLALLGGMLGAGYVLIGAEVRRTVTTSVYTLLCYASCAAVAVVLSVATASPLWGYSTRDWALLIALAVVAQLLGHSLSNVALKRVPATVVATAFLLAVPLSAVIAAVWLGQVPPAAAVPATALVLVGVAVVVRAQARPAEGEA